MTRSKGLIAKRGTRQAFVEANQGQHMCACGCGKAVPIKREHFNVGIPKYRHGHNPTRPMRAKPPRMTCACGCGELANFGKQYVSGHNGRGRMRSDETKRMISEALSGEGNPHWGKTPHNFKGRVVSQWGYVFVHAPDHPFASVKKRVQEHRIVMESHLRVADPASPYMVEVDGELYLRPEIEVHHVNGVKDDNRPENLECMTKSEHTAHHQALKRC